VAQTSRVIIHHEGGGAPRDQWAAIDAEPYSIEVGLTRIEVRNSPHDSFVTNGTSGPSLQVVLSGNRDQYAVTDSDLDLIGEACAVAQSRGWIPAPAQRTCQFHGDTAATACPGSHTRARRDAIYAVVKGTSAPAPGPTPEVVEMWTEARVCPAGTDRNNAGGLQVGLPWGRKSSRVDLYVDCAASEGVALWACQNLEGKNHGLWSGGNQWELWVPGRKLIGVEVSTSVRGLTFAHMGGTTAPLLVTVSGT
jgi:hypothetical protein